MEFEDVPENPLVKPRGRKVERFCGVDGCIECTFKGLSSRFPAREFVKRVREHHIAHADACRKRALAKKVTIVTVKPVFSALKSKSKHEARLAKRFAVEECKRNAKKIVHDDEETETEPEPEVEAESETDIVPFRPILSKMKGSKPERSTGRDAKHRHLVPPVGDDEDEREFYYGDHEDEDEIFAEYDAY